MSHPFQMQRSLLLVGSFAELAAVRLQPVRMALKGRRALRGAVAAVVSTFAVTVAGARLLHGDRAAQPDLEAFIRFQPPSIGEVYDARGEVLIELATEYRRVVRYEDIPPVVRDALLAAEDRSFFEHSGIDVLALPRVAWKVLTSSAATTWRQSSRKGRLVARVAFPQGGSTITQQLVRGYFLRHLTSREEGGVLVADSFLARASARVLGVTATNKLGRKAEEVRLALWLEDELTRRYGSKRRAKEEILARYASSIYLGNGRYGVAAGAEYYFGRPLSTFSVKDADEAAVLAGITKSPRDYAPGPGNMERARRRRDDILRLMAGAGFLPDGAARASVREPIRLFARPKLKTEAPAVVENVFNELRDGGRGGVGVDALVQGRINVHTTVDNRLQRIVNEALEDGLAAYERRHPRVRGLVQGSVVMLGNADGRILAEAGGRRVFRDRHTTYSDFNRVVDSHRQPGSVMKPFVYLAAFRHGAALDSTVLDEPVAVFTGTNEPPKWIHNYDGEFKGPVAVRRALAESRNAATIRLAQEVGIEEVIRTARALGIRTVLQPYITTALGASEVQLLEVANAYRAMASGLTAEPHVIQRITASDGKVLWEAAPAGRVVAIEPEALAAIQEGLRGVVRFGTAYELHARQRGIAVMGKTGTSSDFRDALFVGSTYGATGVTIAVRIGFDDNRELGSGETGGRVALPVFRRIVTAAYEDGILGAPPAFPEVMEDGINAYLSGARVAEAVAEESESEGLAALPSLLLAPRPVLLPAVAPVRPALE